MGIELSTLVAGGDVDVGEVTVTLDLPVKGGLDKVDGGEGAVGDDTSVVTCLGAPGDFVSLRVTDLLAGGGGTEETASGEFGPMSR